MGSEPISYKLNVTLVALQAVELVNGDTILVVASISLTLWSRATQKETCNLLMDERLMLVTGQNERINSVFLG